MKKRNLIPCLLSINITLASFTVEAVDFLGDLSQAIGDVSKSTGDIAKSIKDTSKETPAIAPPVVPSKVVPVATAARQESSSPHKR